MSKDTREQEVKLPKTIQVKVLVPWAIVAFMVTVITSLIFGWFIHVNQSNQVKAEAATIVKNVQVDVQPSKK